MAGGSVSCGLATIGQWAYRPPMPYCPDCSSEYRPDITTCSDCGVSLVDQLAPKRDVTDLYVAMDMLEAELIRGTLSDEGVEAAVLDHKDHVFPTSSTGGGVRIMVPVDKVEQALEVLRAARADGVISTSGRFVSHD